jgi:DNA-binding phage protein
MSEIREAILKQMKKRNMTVYQVAKLVDSRLPQRTVYAFLTGEKDAKTKTASIILKAMGLKITTNNKGRRPRNET